MIKLILTGIVFTLVTANLWGQQVAEVLPNARQTEWSDKEIGVIIHLDINIFAPETFDYSKKETLPPLSAFNPSKLNTDQWILAAKSAGAKYAVLTAKHGTGLIQKPISQARKLYQTAQEILKANTGLAQRPIFQTGIKAPGMEDGFGNPEKKKKYLHQIIF